MLKMYNTSYCYSIILVLVLSLNGSVIGKSDVRHASWTTRQKMFAIGVPVLTAAAVIAGFMIYGFKKHSHRVDVHNGQAITIPITQSNPVSPVNPPLNNSAQVVTAPTRDIDAISRNRNQVNSAPLSEEQKRLKKIKARLCFEEEQLRLACIDVIEQADSQEDNNTQNIADLPNEIWQEHILIPLLNEYEQQVRSAETEKELTSLLLSVKRICKIHNRFFTFNDVVTKSKNIIEQIAIKKHILAGGQSIYNLIIVKIYDQAASQWNQFLDINNNRQNLKEHINQKNMDLRTILHMVAEDYHRPLAKLCLENGVDINAQDVDGRTALMVALNKPTGILLWEQRHYGIPYDDSAMKRFVDLLLLNGARTDLRDNDGKTVHEYPLYAQYMATNA